jgi:hypothetical protein
MRQILVFGALLISHATLAETIKSRIYSIEGNLIKFTNGRVAFLDHKPFAVSKDDFVIAQIDENLSLLSLKRLSDSEARLRKSQPMIYEERSRPFFEPTVVADMLEARNIFNRFNPDYKRISECTDRAHVWAHEEFKFSGTKSMKAFVFFTASYINSVRFKWWFHVAPMYKVNDRGIIKDMVMDYRYTNRPMTVKEWTDQFVHTKRTCKVSTKFSEYDVNPQDENCYLIFESMHYKIPGDIHEQELSGRYKSETSDYELRTSFQFAFQP